MNNEVKSIMLEPIIPSFGEYVVVMLKMPKFILIYVAMSYIGSYIVYMLTTNGIVFFTSFISFFAIIIIAVSRKSLAISKQFLPIVWTLDNERITIESPLMTTIIPSTSLKGVRQISPVVLLFEFKQNMTSRVIYTTEENVISILKMYSSRLK